MRGLASLCNYASYLHRVRSCSTHYIYIYIYIYKPDKRFSPCVSCFVSRLQLLCLQHVISALFVDFGHHCRTYTHVRFHILFPVSAKDVGDFLKRVNLTATPLPALLGHSHSHTLVSYTVRPQWTLCILHCGPHLHPLHPCMRDSSCSLTKLSCDYKPPNGCNQNSASLEGLHLFR